MRLRPRAVREYHVFLASPGDMDMERQEVRRFFDEYNRHTAQSRHNRFSVVDWENYATTGIGDPQQLVTAQTLERFRESLALVIGLMGQRFGSPTSTHESGTEQEFEWALNSYLKTGYPEIKWFFRKVEQFVAPPDPADIKQALGQWQRVQAFRQRLRGGQAGIAHPPLYYREFSSMTEFQNILRQDLSLWLSAQQRPWA